MTKHQYDSVVRLWEDGLNTAQIAKQLKLPEPEIDRAVMRMLKAWKEADGR